MSCSAKVEEFAGWEELAGREVKEALHSVSWFLQVAAKHWLIEERVKGSMNKFEKSMVAMDEVVGQSLKTLEWRDRQVVGLFEKQ